MRIATAPRSRNWWLGATALGLSLLVVCPALAQELPTGGAVKAGSAAIQQGGAGLTVHQSTSRAVIDWKSFGVGAGGKVSFEQPNAGSVILNRVTGPDASRIAGTLSANGQVFLVNQNGIVVTPTGTIDTRGGFVGSTLDIKDADFMAGRYHFEGEGGFILNQGRILSGPGAAVALIGGQVSNAGLISAPLGRVALGSGLAATLDLSGDGFLQLALPADAADAAGRPLVDNSGRIEADGGRVILQAATARDAVRRLVNMSGVIVARSLSGADGSVLLDGGDGGSVQVSGQIDASGETNGGRVDVTGGDVTLTGAQVLASGGERGGLVRIGGAFQGGSTATGLTPQQLQQFVGRFGPLPALAAAGNTVVDADSLIDVSGGVAGGTAVLWSAGKTVQAGRILAEGGAAEISSRGVLQTDLGKVRLGAGGLLLLDPQDIEVNQAGGFGSGTPTPYTGPVGFSDNSGNISYFDVADLEAQIHAGTNVVLKASQDISWLTDFNGNIADAHPGSIFLSAGRSVTFTGILTLQNSNLTVVANDTAANGVVDADRGAGSGGIDTLSAELFGGVGSFSTGGNISLTVSTGAGNTNHTAGNLRLGPIESDGGAITLSTSGQSGAKLRFFPDTTVQNATDQVAITATGAVTLTGPLDVQTIGGLTVTGSSVTWTDEATSALTGFSGAPVAFVENSVTTRYGLLGSGAQTRLALGVGGSSPQYTRAYGAADPTFSSVPRIVSGALRGSDTLATLLGAGSLSVTGPASTVTPGDYNVTTSATGSFAFAPGVTGYFIDLRAVNDTLHVTPKVLTPSVTAGGYVYGSPTTVVNLSGIINGDTIAPVVSLSSGGSATLAGSSGAYAFANTTAAGSRTFTVASLTGTNAGNYSLNLGGTISAALNISQKPLNYTILDASTTYGTLATPISSIDTALVGSDVVTVGALTVTKSGASSTLSATTGTGTYVVTLGSLSGGAAANYSIASSGNTTGTLTVAAKPLSFSVANASSTYGTLATAGAAGLTGVVGVDDVSGVVQVLDSGSPITLAARTAAGAYTETVGALTGAAAANYTLTGGVATNGTLTIAAKPVTYAVTGGSQTYGSQASVMTLTGVLAGDAVVPAVDDGGSTVVLTDIGSGHDAFDNHTAAGSHSFTLIGLVGAQAGDYSINLGTGTTGLLTVAAKSLTYAIAPVSTTYGTAATPSAVLTGAVGGDDVAGSVVANGGGTTLDTHTAVGGYALSVSGLTGTTAGNYVIAGSGNSNSTLTVGARTITYSVADASSTYGTLASIGSASLTNLVGGDSVTGVVSATLAGSPVSLTARSAAGTYALAVSGLTGAQASNYVIAGSGNTDGALTIAQKSVTYSLGAFSSTYGTVATAAPTLTGVLGGDTVTGNLMLRFGGTVFAPPARLSVGDYPALITGLGGADAANYFLSGSGNTEGTLTIAPKALGFSLETSATVFGQTFVPRASLTGAVPGDLVFASVQVTDGASYVVDPTLPIHAGTYTQTVSLTGLNAGDYTVSGGGTGSLSVAQRPIVAGAQVGVFSPGGDSTAGYGAVRPSDVQAGYLFGSVGGALLTGPLANADLQASVVAPSLPASTGGYLKAGAYVFTLGALTGSAAGDYVLAQPFIPATFTVTKQPLRVSTTASNTTYGTPVPFTTSGLSGVLAGDVVSAAAVQGFPLGGGAAVPLDAHAPAGRYQVQVSGVTGADIDNYAFQAIGIPTVDIFQKPLTYVTGNSATTYGTLASLGSASLTGIVGSDVVNGTVDIAGGLAARSSAGTHQVLVTGLTGAGSVNYSVASSGNTIGTLTISPITLTYTNNATSLSAVYGARPSWDVQLNGVLSGDTVAPQVLAKLTTSSFVGDAGDTYTLDGATLAPASAYTVSMGRAAGKYTLTGSAAGNYVLADDGLASLGTMSITPRPLTYRTPTISAVYGDPSTATATFTNAVAGDVVTYDLVLTGSGSVYTSGDARAPYTPVGLYALTPVLNFGSSVNYTLSNISSVIGNLTVTPRPITLTPTNKTYVYGDTLTNLVSLPNPLGDDITPTINFFQRALTLDRATDGTYSLDFYLTVGGFNYTVTGLTGSRASNYTFTNPGAAGTITIAPRPITFSVADVTGYYAGRNLPCTFNCGGDDDIWGLGNLTTGAVTLNNLVNNDPVSGKVRLVSLSGATSDYAENTRAGTYFEVVSELTGTNSGNYVLASTGSTAGVMTIKPVPLIYTVSSGGRLYSGDQVIPVGTPGIVTIDIGRNTPGFVAGDDVQTGPIFLANSPDGSPYTRGEPLFPGDYLLVIPGLTGKDAGNYDLHPFQLGGHNVSQPGVLTVSNADVFNFGFLGASDPLQPYVAPPPSGSIVKAYADAQAAAAAKTSVTIVGGLSASVSAGADAKAGVSVGPVSLTVDAGATTSALASFGIRGAKAKAQVEAEVSVTLQAGPASISYGADVNAAVLAKASLLSMNPSLKLNAMVNAEVTQTTTVQGDLGGGVDGSISTNASLFVEAHSDNDMSVDLTNGNMKFGAQEFVGVGGSAGVSGGLSGGGVSGNASVTVYSPGSLYIGTTDQSDYSDGKLTLGFSMGMALGFGGLNIAPSITIDTAPIISTGEDFAEVVSFGGFTRSKCDDACQRTNQLNTDTSNALAIYKKSGRSLDLLNAISSDPGIFSDSNMAAAKGADQGDLAAMRLIYSRYADLPDKLNDVLSKEQALTTRLQSNPSSITVADMKEAADLRTLENSYASQVDQLQAKLSVSNGMLVMVDK